MKKIEHFISTIIKICTNTKIFYPKNTQGKTVEDKNKEYLSKIIQSIPYLLNIAKLFTEELIKNKVNIKKTNVQYAFIITYLRDTQNWDDKFELTKSDYTIQFSKNTKKKSTSLINIDERVITINVDIENLHKSFKPIFEEKNKKIEINNKFLDQLSTRYDKLKEKILGENAEIICLQENDIHFLLKNETKFSNYSYLWQSKSNDHVCKNTSLIQGPLKKIFGTNFFQNIIKIPAFYDTNSIICQKSSVTEVKCDDVSNSEECELSHTDEFVNIQETCHKNNNYNLDTYKKLIAAKAKQEYETLTIDTNYLYPDGVSVYFDKTKFRLLEQKSINEPCFVYCKLQEKNNCTITHVISAHLTSGHDKSKIRISEIKNILMTIFPDDLQNYKHKSKTKTNVNTTVENLLSIVGSKNKAENFLVCMDANEHFKYSDSKNKPKPLLDKKLKLTGDASQCPGKEAETALELKSVTSIIKDQNKKELESVDNVKEETFSYIEEDDDDDNNEGKYIKEDDDDDINEGNFD